MRVPSGGRLLGRVRSCTVLIRPRQEHVTVMDTEASRPVLEAYVLVVEGDPGKREFIRKPVKRI